MSLALKWSVITTCLWRQEGEEKSAMTFAQVERGHSRHDFAAVVSCNMAQWRLQRNQNGASFFPHYNFFSSKVKGHKLLLTLYPCFLFFFFKHPLFPQILWTVSKLFLVYVWKLHHKGELRLWKSVVRWGWNDTSASQEYEQPSFFSPENLNIKLPIYIDVRICIRRCIKLSASLHYNAALEEVNL